MINEEWNKRYEMPASSIEEVDENEKSSSGPPTEDPLASVDSQCDAYDPLEERIARDYEVKNEAEVAERVS